MIASGIGLVYLWNQTMVAVCAVRRKARKI